MCLSMSATLRHSAHVYHGRSFNPVSQRSLVTLTRTSRFTSLSVRHARAPPRPAANAHTSLRAVKTDAFPKGKALTAPLHRPLALAVRANSTVATSTPGKSQEEAAVTDPFAHLPAYQPPTKGFLSKLPAAWVPYFQLMRVEQTGGLYAFYTANAVGMAWAASVASPPLAAGQILWVAGVSLMYVVWHRGAACISNDIWDVEYDRKVARSRHRPLARGAVTVRQATIWYAANVAIAGGILVTLMPHPLACLWNAAPAITVLSIYPLFKRFTHYPQLVLCQPLAWAALMSCAALGVDPWTALDAPQAAATACLVGSLMAYYVQLDYVNACQDTADDIKAGVRSMAVRWQNQRAVLGTIASMQIALMLSAGWLAGLGPAYFIGACGGNAAILFRMATTVSRDRPDLCAWWFRRGSLLIGGSMTLGIFLEYLWGRLAGSKAVEGVENTKAIESQKTSS